ncbi:MAG TPA: type I 3-dehydroquinate dehydratase [Acidobacteriota bacterium]|nr:type I 3-dehydroquinate dehydratase [Acidobacteriota bacterium]
MICVSIAEPTAEECLSALEGVPFAEIRLDRMIVNENDVRRIFSARQGLIAACRPGGLAAATRKALLLAAVAAGASYVDIEIGSGQAYKRPIVAAARRAACRIIVSYHNFGETPPRSELEAVVERCFAAGADVAKIACRVGSERDNARLLGLLDDPRPLAVMDLGGKGAKTRVMAALLGAAFVYASRGEGRETAEGQIPQDRLASIIRTMGEI